MKITAHGSNLIQLTRLTAFNCFLVREQDGFTLVDTGMGGSAKAILKAAADYGGVIRRIVLTHAHVDHVGSLDALHASLPDAEVAISARDARFMAGDRSLDAEESSFALKGGYPRCTTTPTHLLHAGDRIGSLETIPSPGHTPGHLAFFDHRDRTLLAGDAFTTKAGISTGGTFRLLFPFPAMATWHRQLATTSAEQLRELKPARLAVGHGAVLEDPVAGMDQAIAEARRTLGMADHGTR